MIKVLIVDDEKLVRQGMISIMPWAEFGLEVAGDVNSGEKALEFLKLERVDLLITDLAMPVMSGLELIKKVQLMYPDIWTVVLTFHQDFGYIQEALRLGAIDYILKTQLEKEHMGDVLGRIVGRIESETKRFGSKAAVAPPQAAATAPPASAAPAAAATAPPASAALAPAVSAPLAPTASPAPATAVQELREGWSAFKWVYDESIYTQLLDSIAALRSDPDKIKYIFYSASIEWEHSLSLMNIDINLEPPENMQNWQEWAQWISNARALLREKTRKPAYSDDISRSIMNALDIINKSKAVDIKQESVARLVGMSRSYFSQCFRGVTGAAFNDYVRNAKITKAKLFLTHTNRPIYWISEQIGYLNEKHFSRVFHGITGMLPSEYRNKYGKS